MSKRKDMCLFCNSRCCYERIASLEDGGKTYDEIACRKHVDDLYRHAYGGKDKVRMCKMSGTGKMSRGEAFEVPEIFLQKTEMKVTVHVDDNVTEEQLEGVCKSLEAALEAHDNRPPRIPIEPKYTYCGKAWWTCHCPGCGEGMNFDRDDYGSGETADIEIQCADCDYEFVVVRRGYVPPQAQGKDGAA